MDNNGCVYVRAGFDGNVTWVPRVSRSREQVCGQKPTFGTVAAAPAAPATSAPQIAVTAPAPKPTPKPAPRPTATARVAAPSPAPAPTVISKPVVRAPASKPVAAQPPRVVRRVPVVPAPAAPKVATKSVKPLAVPVYGNCANGVRTRTFNGQTLQVRCGPQTTPHVTEIRRGEAPAPGKNVYYNKSWNDSSLNLPGETRIIPRHVYEQRDTAALYIPEGYRPAWEDDRLNPYRALQTVDGYRQSQQVWTHTVPRTSVLSAKAKDVHGHDPIVVGTAQPGSYYKAPLHYEAPVVASSGTYRSPVVSTKGSSRYVQIGVFTTDAKAQAAVSRLSAAGLPVKLSTTGRGQLLRVGPYKSSEALYAALNATHGTGYVQAYIN
ncbi:SPOR domain-containing protein [Tropicibacter naphthalenivorans]|uniref:SPOR domain-containing protein n=1 Tax=Tropicibacter naphthalenivorans TaxID=441103 RepID=UPI001F1ECE53|nr:SPOR domain-containing protein [Tropicibacter naphthalenivorans]